MNIKLYQTPSPHNKVVKQLNLITSIDGESKQPIDALNCRYVLSIGHMEGVKASNYLYSGATGKYYYINKYTIEYQHIIIDCRVDPLMTYAAEIKATEAVITRTAEHRLMDGYLTDGQYKAKAYKNIVTKSFPNKMNDMSIILMTVG